ncbi:unnamed protein product [Prunus brigantina]
MTLERRSSTSAWRLTSAEVGIAECEVKERRQGRIGEGASWAGREKWDSSIVSHRRRQTYILIITAYQYIYTWREESSFRLREVSIYREMKVGGLCRFPMWDFAHVVVEECLPSA